MYAWTAIHNGGEGEMVDVASAGGRNRRYVIKSRNITPAGAEVTQKDLDVDDETWQHFIDEGIVRDYPYPEGTDDYTSPSQAFLAGVSTGTGEVDINKLMDLGLSNPAAGAYEEDEEVVTAPSGA